MTSERDAPANEDFPPTYQVVLEVFEGPLDLLLRLIEREELDISKVSLAAVADQYLAHVAMLQEVSAANLADFLVIAARLLVIKSRSLLPRLEVEVDEAEEGDIGEELARRLLEYKRFKEVAGKLRDIEATGLRAFPRIAPPPKMETRLQPGEVTLAELLEAFQRALEVHPPTAPVDQVLAPIKVSITDCIETIYDLLRERRRARFSTLLRRARSRMEVVVTFLAMLELIKQRRLRVTQEEPFGEIYIEERGPSPDEGTARRREWLAATLCLPLGCLVGGQGPGGQYRPGVVFGHSRGRRRGQRPPPDTVAEQVHNLPGHCAHVADGHQQPRLVVQNVLNVLPHCVGHHGHFRGQQIDQLDRTLGPIDQRIIEGVDGHVPSRDIVGQSQTSGDFSELLLRHPPRPDHAPAQAGLGHQAIETGIVLGKQSLAHDQQTRIRYLGQNLAQDRDHPPRIILEEAGV